MEAITNTERAYAEAAEYWKGRWAEADAALLAANEELIRLKQEQLAKAKKELALTVLDLLLICVALGLIWKNWP